MKTIIEEYLDKAARAATALSAIAKNAGNLPTMYAANRAWHELSRAADDLEKRKAALTNRERNDA